MNVDVDMKMDMTWIKLLSTWTLFNSFTNSNCGRGCGFSYSTNDFKHFASFNLDVDMIVDLSCFKLFQRGCYSIFLQILIVDVDVDLSS